MPSDIEIAHSVHPRPINEIAAQVGLGPADLEPYGFDKAKISSAATRRLVSDPERMRGKLVVVTAITPTPAGEGKTTVAVGLAQALCAIGKRAIAVIREPSLGPVFGMKGGATGGGYAQLLPMEDINLHFTGDMHALTTANNLLAAIIDNHLYQGNALRLDPLTLTHRRCLDVNDRSLRQIVTGLGGHVNGSPREAAFQITVATEMMAALCLSDSLSDLKIRIGNIVVGQNSDALPVTASDLGVSGAMAALLKDAIKPNLVQTLEGTPAFVHGGPFANIAHGCSSVIAARLALCLGEVVVTEAGFGSDLGFEKFCDIVAASRQPDLNPDAVVLVATVRALKMHGGVSKRALNGENTDAVRRGLANLDRHVQIIAQTGVPFVVTVNKFAQDFPAEIDEIVAHCQQNAWPVATNNVWGEGGEGGRMLAEEVTRRLDQPSAFIPFYDRRSSIEEKIDTLASKVYGASSIEWSAEALKQLRWLKSNGWDRLPVCVAKTQYSLSDDPTRRGAPTDFALHVRSLSLSAGAGFVVVIMGDILTMPGLPRHPAALDIDVDENGNITGLY